MLNAHRYLEAISKRLPYHVKLDYVRESSTQGVDPSFEELLNFVVSRAYACNTFYGKLLAQDSKNNSKQPIAAFKSQTTRAYATVSAKPDSSLKSNLTESSSAKPAHGIECPCCKETHTLTRCKKFSSLEMPKRIEFVMDAK